MDRTTLRSIVAALIKAGRRDLAEAAAKKFTPAMRKKAEQAVKQMQLLNGLRRSGPGIRLADEKKLVGRVRKLVDQLVRMTGNEELYVRISIEQEAQRRGPITPMPGMDI